MALDTTNPNLDDPTENDDVALQLGNASMLGQVGELIASLPAIEADGGEREMRLSRLHNHIVESEIGPKVRQALSGRYFVASSPTPGTGIAAAIQTSFSATSGLVSIKNGGTNQIVLDYIKMLVTQAPASATSLQIAAFLDFVARFASGGSTLTSVATKSAAAESAAEVVVNVGALTLNAAGANQRRVARACPRSVIAVVNDEIYLDFADEVLAGSDDEGGTTAKRVVVPMPPTVIEAGAEFVLNAWLPSNAVTALAAEFEIGFLKR